MHPHDDARQDDDTTRRRDSGAGYPEEGRPGTGVDPREHPENEAPPDAAPTPATSTDDDADPSRATGNPRAAGG